MQFTDNKTSLYISSLLKYRCYGIYICVFITPKYAHTHSLFCKKKILKHFSDILDKRIVFKEAYVRSDNAGCFHGFASIYAMPFLSSEIKCAHILLIPKGASAFVTKKYPKIFIRRRVNEGNDVYTPKYLWDALQKSNMKKCRFKCSGRANFQEN